MSKSLCTLRAIMLFIFSWGLAVQPSFAQLRFANALVASVQTGTVFNNSRAADGDLATSATLVPPLLLGFTRLRVSFPFTAVANQEAGFYVGTTNLIAVALLSGATFNTYLATGTTTTAVDSYPLSTSLLNLQVLTSGVTKVSFMPTQSFNQLEIVYFSVLSLGENINFYEAYATAPTPLPVELVSFQGKATATGNQLTWTTASEHNSDHFVVERSDNPQQGFQALTKLAGAGQSAAPRTYDYLDATPSLLSYYRLRQVDRDGTVAFSPLVAVRATLRAGLLAYPSPAPETLTVVGPAGSQLEVFNHLGQRVVELALSPIQQQQQLDVRALPAGRYFLRDRATGQHASFVKP